MNHSTFSWPSVTHLVTRGCAFLYCRAHRTWKIPTQSCSPRLGGICLCQDISVAGQRSRYQYRLHPCNGILNQRRGRNAALPVQDWRNHSRSALQILGVHLTEYAFHMRSRNSVPFIVCKLISCTSLTEEAWGRKNIVFYFLWSYCVFLHFSVLFSFLIFESPL